MNIKNDSLSVSVDNNISFDSDQQKLCHYVESKLSISDSHITWNQMGSEKSLNLDEEPPRKKSLFDSAEDEDIDLYGWMEKPVEAWNKIDSINWLLWAAVVLRQAYGQLSPELAMPGKKLLCLKRQDFFRYDPHSGGKLHDLLHEGRDSNGFRVIGDITIVPSFESMETDTVGETSVGRGDDSLDKEPAVDLDSTNKPRSKRPKLPQFIIHLLSDEMYSGWICWVNRDEKLFRFVQGDKVAKVWGKLRGKKTMNYEKFTRAMRYYYGPKGEDFRTLC